MANLEIDQFPGELPQDDVIFHGKNAAGQDINMTGLGVKNFVLSAIPEEPDYHELALRTLNGADLLKLEKNTQDGYAATSLNAIKNFIGNILRPVGSAYINFSNSTNPSVLFGFGTWVQEARGRMILGQGTGTDVNGHVATYQAGNEGGEYFVALSPQQMPPHVHKMFGNDSYYGTATIMPTGEQTVAAVFGNYTVNESYRMSPTSVPGSQPVSGSTSRVGGTGSGTNGAPHNNMPPFVTVYIWRRVA